MKILKSIAKYILILFALVFLFEVGRGTAYNIKIWYTKPRGEDLKRYFAEVYKDNKPTSH